MSELEDVKSDLRMQKRLVAAFDRTLFTARRKIRELRNRKCCNCRHWDDNSYGIGWCSRITEETENVLIHIGDHKEQGCTGHLMTVPDFGCTLWSKKQNDNSQD
jgi:hypothetical protein